MNTSPVEGRHIAVALTFTVFPMHHTLGQTTPKWALQLGIDAFFDMAKEFWPHIDRHVFMGVMAQVASNCL